jgi:Fe2+ or Zn2+ uptake regulation protein
MKSFRPYAIALVLFVIWLTCQSCGSSRTVAKSKTQKYFDKVVQHKQFAIVNNQIIIFENN